MRDAAPQVRPWYMANYAGMTDQDRIKLLEYKLLVLSKQFDELVAGLERHIGAGINKPVPQGLGAAIREVASLAVTPEGDEATSRTARSGFDDHPRTVGDLPNVIH